MGEKGVSSKIQVFKELSFPDDIASEARSFLIDPVHKIAARPASRTPAA